MTLLRFYYGFSMSLLWVYFWFSTDLLRFSLCLCCAFTQALPERGHGLTATLLGPYYDLSMTLLRL